MNLDIWWVVLIGGLCFVAGIAITLVTAAFLIPTPDGRTYIGDLPPAPQDDP